jgi:hypothetical protein
MAKHAVARMKTEIREGVGNLAYKDYIQALKKWPAPYFGTTCIRHGTEALDLKWRRWHQRRLPVPARNFWSFRKLLFWAFCGVYWRKYLRIDRRWP